MPYTLQWIEYNTDSAKQAIQDYINGLTLYDPVTGQPTDVIDWRQYPSNPVPADYDIEMHVSGYIEDLRPIKEQLGTNRIYDPNTGQYVWVSGSIWNIDYEFHLEQGTLAMLQPVVKLAQDTVRPVAESIVDQINDLERQTKFPLYEITVTCDVSQSYFMYDGTSYDNFSIPLMDHWPRFQFMAHSWSVGGFGQIVQLPEEQFQVANRFIDMIIVQRIHDGSNYRYQIQLPAGPQMNMAYNGTLLIY